MKTDAQRIVMGLISSPVKNAHEIARALVEKKLAACAQITGSIQSIYHWDNAIQEDSEVLIYVKTHFNKIEEINQLLSDIHPYDVPEFIVIPLLGGNPDYFKWVETTVL